MRGKGENLQNRTAYVDRSVLAYYFPKRGRALEENCNIRAQVDVNARK